MFNHGGVPKGNRTYVEAENPRKSRDRSLTDPGLGLNAPAPKQHRFVTEDLVDLNASQAALRAGYSPRTAPKQGPRLEGAGRRLQAKWLSRFLSDPVGTQPGTTMPDVLHGIPVEKKTRTVLALTAFLATLREPFPNLASTATRPVAPRFYEKGSRDRGRTLFHQAGCVACHQPDATYKARPQPTSELEKLLAQLDPDELKALGLETVARPFPSVPHGRLAAKYTARSLAHFLVQPETARPAGRMPSLKLVPEEAADLVDYLRSLK